MVYILVLSCLDLLMVWDMVIIMLRRCLGPKDISLFKLAFLMIMEELCSTPSWLLLRPQLCMKDSDDRLVCLCCYQKVATSEHCMSRRHRWRLCQTFNGKPSPSEDARMIGGWRLHVEAWGFDPDIIEDSFGCPGMATLVPSVFEFNSPVRRPAYDVTTDFWGARFFLIMRGILDSLRRKPMAFQDCEDYVYSALVYGNCTRAQMQSELQASDDGMWYPCLAVRFDGAFYTWGVAFAVQRSHQAWLTHETRLILFPSNEQERAWLSVRNPTAPMSDGMSFISDYSDSRSTTLSFLPSSTSSIYGGTWSSASSFGDEGDISE